MPQLSALPWVLYFFYSLLPLMMMVFISSMGLVSEVLLSNDKAMLIMMKW
uniref:ATP synthase F0 subunit 8 n=1 Tax=Parachtes limbarae TaxID=1110490 RepID=A0A516IM95_9ARAC|nr:ATP synthase F0 subunit 8 [Parachtes limbarae]